MFRWKGERTHTRVYLSLCEDSYSQMGSEVVRSSKNLLTLLADAKAQHRNDPETDVRTTPEP